ncbi:hypothetical protein [Hyalangium rubrum]|uniref:Uncharacterized protein n=1 Tax=Hyalangium rubrum TaxID=3103134 RepID=A0ABU5HGZ5_9BACT|nr:hypothetical protein [Hyalangium sp. s54d21]MDY7232733.1 hypothetical protein [Hyalangium sp. s54d21]
MSLEIRRSLFKKAGLPVVLAMLSAPVAFAHTPEMPRGQGVHTQGQPQPSPRSEARAGTMPGANLQPGTVKLQAQPMLVGGKVRTMEEALKSPGQVAGELPPRRQVQASLARGGTQQDPVRQAPASGSHLRVVLRVTADGESEVVSATELPGEAKLSEEPKGDLVYEVSDGTQTLAVEALPELFEAHSFGGPEDDLRGHAFHVQKEATIVVTVPQRNLRSNLERLNVRLYRITSGPATEEINPATLEKLKAGRHLQPLVESRGGAFGRQIQERSFKVRE